MLARRLTIQLSDQSTNQVHDIQLQWEVHSHSPGENKILVT